VGEPSIGLWCFIMAWIIGPSLRLLEGRGFNFWGHAVLSKI